LFGLASAITVYGMGLRICWICTLHVAATMCRLRRKGVFKYLLTSRLDMVATRILVHIAKLHAYIANIFVGGN